MKIAVIGCGYVGLVQAAGLANLGHNVIGIDVDSARIAGLSGTPLRCPIHEPGLPALLAKTRAAGKLHFSTHFDAIDGCEMAFICVGTPPDKNGRADMGFIWNVVDAIRARALAKPMKLTLVMKSTVPPGTNEAICRRLAGAAANIDVVSNPEFLREGTALEDFQNPDRIVVGARPASVNAAHALITLYGISVVTTPTFLVTPESAELAKYAANAMLAARVSLMNEVSWIAEASGADVEEVRKIVGADPRIGTEFLKAGIGYGGSCFPKDVKALAQYGADHGVDHTPLLWGVQNANQEAAFHFISRVYKKKPKRVAIWGLTFKPNTDDTRLAPASTIAAQLAGQGVTITSYDPVVKGTHDTALGAAEGADALLLCTEWVEFRVFTEWDVLKSVMAKPVIFDGRNALIEHVATLKKLGFEYHGVGREP